jgi:hypothetical protein
MFNQVCYIRLRLKYPSHHFVFTSTCTANYTIEVMQNGVMDILTANEYNKLD